MPWTRRVKHEAYCEPETIEKSLENIGILWPFQVSPWLGENRDGGLIPGRRARGGWETEIDTGH